MVRNSMDAMQKPSKFFVITALITLAVSGWGVWYLFVNANQLLIGLIAGLLPSIITIIIYLWNQQREHKNWLLRNNEAFLIEIIDMIVSMTENSSTANLAKQIKTIQPALIAHGSKDVLEAWVNIQNISDDDDMSETFRQYEGLLRTIRRDLGHDDSDIPAGHILATIIKADEREALLQKFEGVRYD